MEQLKIEAGRALQRQKERRAHERNLQKRNKKPWASPPREGKQEGMPPTQERGAKSFVPKGKLTIKKRP